MGFITNNLRGRSRLSKATDSIFAPRNQPPDWLTGIGAVVGAVALVALLGYSAFSAAVGEDVNATAPARQQQVINVDAETGAAGPAPEEETSGEPEVEDPPAAPPEVPAPGEAPALSDDFSAKNMVTVGITDTSTTSQIPAGALNLAAAGFNAMITGEWTPLPKTAAPVLPTPRSGATLDTASITISPASASSGGKSFTFTATFTTAEGRQEQSQLTIVSKTDGSYQIRPL